jgi:hypothetical protein
MVRRFLIGVSSLGFLLTGIFPLSAYAQQTTLQICVIANPGDTCGGNLGGSGGGRGGSGNSGGGGGGGAIAPPFVFNPTTGEVHFSGIAYPSSAVTLFRDGQFLAKTTAGPDAQFQVDVSNVTPGTYNYTVFSEDSHGVKSVTNSFSVAVTPGVGTVISGIYLPPTIDVDKAQVKKGDPITILGSSAPNVQINILVHSSQEIVRSTSSDKNGLWKYVLDTLDLEYGTHDASARWKDNGGISPLSGAASFVVGDTSILKKTFTLSSTVDIDGDNKVDAIDFSILAYWYKRTLTGRGLKADLNHDGKVDARDFSILAYYWGR